MYNCDIYLFCLWRKSRPYWDYIINDIGKEYRVAFMFKGIFPNYIDFLQRFYNNERIGNYRQKLSNIAGEFVSCVAVDDKFNDFDKLDSAKLRYRNLSSIPNDYDFLHSSQTVPEFIRQISILERVKWKKLLKIW